MFHPRVKLRLGKDQQSTSSSAGETVSDCWAVLLSRRPQIPTFYLHLDKYYVSYKGKDNSEPLKAFTFTVKRKMSASGLWEVVITNKYRFPIFMDGHKVDEYEKQVVLDRTSIAVSHPNNLCYILQICDGRGELGDHNLFEKILSLEQPILESTLSFSYSTRFKTDSDNLLTLKVLDRVKLKAMSDGLNYLQEVALLHQFDHDCLDRIIEFKATPETLYMVMDGALSRQTMVEYLQRLGRVREIDLQPLFRQLLEALHFLHAKGQIAHNNIDFNSVQVDNKSRQIKLTDFTYARRRGDDVIVISRDKNHLPCLIPPEMSGHGDGTITLTDQTAADMWCVGKMICIALTRPLPIASLLSEDEIGCNSACVIVTSSSIPLPDQLKDVSVDVEILSEELLFEDPKLRCSADVALRSTWITEPVGTKRAAEQ